MKTAGKGQKRKALSEMQPSTANQRGLLVSDGVMRLNFVKKPKNPAFIDAENPAPPRSTKADRHGEQDSPCDAYDLMVNEEVPAQYWKQLAEQRRVALETALKENEQLHEQVELLTAENRHLQTIADQALPLAELLKELTGGTLPCGAE